MNARADAWTIDNAAWNGATPLLSVLIPFFRDDPCPLLRALDEQARSLQGRVEVAALDDGSADEGLAERVAAVVAGMATPARFIRLAANEGRARGRNRLTAAARGASFLFIDSDMAPDAPDFLARWLELVEAENPAAAFGGFTLDQTEARPEFALHRAVTLRAECRPAAWRQADPAKTLCASNLLVRRDVFEAEPFDARFTGWGWEEVEWAIRVARRWPVRHLDNTASHLGLDRAPALLAKYEQSQGNFARMAADHPEVARAFPSWRAARALSRLPQRPVWRAALRRAALSERLPLTVRVFAAKLFRAAVYAEVV